MLLGGRVKPGHDGAEGYMQLTAASDYPLSSFSAASCNSGVAAATQLPPISP